MNNHTDKESLIEKFKQLHQALQWTLGGMMGGLVVGIALVAINGLNLLSVAYWLGFGVLVGALSGVIGWVITSLAKKIISAK